MTGERSLLETAIDEVGPERFAEMVRMLPPEQQHAMAFDWSLLARPSQLPPPGNWLTWLVLAGRGFGKTRTGAEFVRAEVEAGRARRIALVAPTVADARNVMVPTLLAVCPYHLDWQPTNRRVVWPGGRAIATTYSADESRQLRGPEHDLSWADELAAWFDPEDAWNMLQFGLRVGVRPRCVVTTTPRPIELLKKLLADPTVHLTRGRTLDNASNLDAARLKQLITVYQNTRLGRQELEGEILSDVEGALWSLAQIDAARVRQAPELKRVVIGVDPAVSTKGDLTGIVVAGIGECLCQSKRALHGFVLANYSGRHSPAEWARIVTMAYHKHGASRIVVEANQGGQLLTENLRINGAANLPIRMVHAKTSKHLRAEPVSSLYEQSRIHHVGTGAGLRDLETQMCEWSPMTARDSPDMVDAAVYALSDLMLRAGACLSDGPVEDHVPLGPSSRDPFNASDRWGGSSSLRRR